MDLDELKRFFVNVIEEEFTPTPTPIGKRWTGGKLLLQPDNDTQSKEIPLDVFFRKIVGVRDALRVLEQRVNSNDALSSEDKISMQSYITKCYGSLTTFNILFRDDKDKFVGAGSSDQPRVQERGDGDSQTVLRREKLTVAEAKKKLGLNEFGNE